jgi:hypothetical protein
VQVPLVVEDDRPARALPLQRGAGVGASVGHAHHRRVLQVGDVDAGHRQPLEAAVGAHEVCDEGVRRLPQQLGGGRELLHVSAVAHHRDAVADAHGLLDVVGDEDDRLAHRLLQAQELRLQAFADHRVDGGERFVHQQHRRVGGQRPRYAGPLPLPARQLGRVAVTELLRVEADGVQQLVHPLPDPLPVPAEQPRHGADVRAHRLVREQAHALDDVADATAQLVGVDAGHVLATEQDPAGAGLDDPVDHLHRGGLAAAGRAHEDRELARGEGQVELGDAHRAVGVDLAHALEPDLLGRARACRTSRWVGGLRSSVHGVTLLGSARW